MIWHILKSVYNLLSIFALLIFGNIAALSIYQVIRDGIVYTTTIHGIFLNPYFLIAGSYIGIYILYRVFLLSMKEHQGH